MKNNTRYIKIQTNEQLYNCVKSGVSLEVYVSGELDFIGQLVDFTDNLIKFEDGFYLRSLSEVIIRENYFLKK
ncbi:UNVERIFIED_CONTAM: hypothetical protein ABIC26_005032 [Paenibacillus sp. PvR008]